MAYAVTTIAIPSGKALASVVRDTYRAARLWADVNAATWRAHGAFHAFVTDADGNDYAGKVYGADPREDGDWIRKSQIANDCGGTE